MKDENAQQMVPVPVPALRIAPLGELNIWQITEQELNEFEQGSPAPLLLNLSLFLLGSGLTFLVSLIVTDITSIKVFNVFVILAVLFLAIGMILLALWYRTHRSTKSLAQRIRERMPPAPGIPEVAIEASP